MDAIANSIITLETRSQHKLSALQVLASKTYSLAEGQPDGKGMAPVCQQDKVAQRLWDEGWCKMVFSLDEKEHLVCCSETE